VNVRARFAWRHDVRPAGHGISRAWVVGDQVVARVAMDKLKGFDALDGMRPGRWSTDWHRPEFLRPHRREQHPLRV